jgi:hypothetical protein
MKPLLPLLILAPDAVLAHPGGHSGLSSSGILRHLASAPDHVAVILAVIGLALVVLHQTWSRR